MDLAPFAIKLFKYRVTTWLRDIGLNNISLIYQTSVVICDMEFVTVTNLRKFRLNSVQK